MSTSTRFSPNIPDIPTEFITEVTGMDVMVTEEGRRKTSLFNLAAVVERLLEGTRDTALREAERLGEISRRLTEVFKDEESLKRGLWEVAQRKAGLPASVSADALLTAVREAAKEGSKINWLYAARKRRPGAFPRARSMTRSCDCCSRRRREASSGFRPRSSSR